MSVEMLQEDFPQFHIIANTVNEGVAKAYNQAIKLARGEYILLVNADTISGKDPQLEAARLIAMQSK